jgi:hypothetical protein
MMDRVHEFRFRQTTDKLRFIAPASSTDAERRELQMAGAVAG